MTDAVVVDEADEAGVLDAVALIRRDGKDDALAHGELRGEAQFVVGVGEPLDALEGAPQFAADGLRSRGARGARFRRVRCRVNFSASGSITASAWPSSKPISCSLMMKRFFW